MTARLSPLQRQVLEQLAHIRVAPEDAWLTTARIATLTSKSHYQTENRMWQLHRRELVRFDPAVRAWRITDKGREALT